MYSIYILVILVILIDKGLCQNFITPEYVRADEYGTAYFRAPAPKIGPIKSRIHIENLIKLENELIGLGELILETEEKLHQKELIRKAELVKKQMESKRAGKKEVQVEEEDPEHQEHDFTQEKAYLEKVKAVNTAILEDMRTYSGNPLAMFPIRKRLAFEWPAVLANITNCSMVHEYPAINEHFRYLKFFLQVDGDIDVAYEDLLRLQKTYAIPVSSLARGWWGKRMTTSLNITDIIAIADICLDREDMAGALEWLLQVAKLVKGLGLQGKEKLRYMNILGSAYIRMGKLKEAKLVYNSILKEDPQNRIAQANIDLADMKIKEQELSVIRMKEREKEEKLRKAKKMMGSVGKVNLKEESEEEAEEGDDLEQIKAGKLYKRQFEDDQLYEEEWWIKFCRGDKPQDTRGGAHLVCHEKYIPLMERRIKVEVLSTNPPIYVLKDVLTENMITQTINHATEEMEKRIHAYSVEDASSPLVYTDENSWMEPFVFRMRNITYQTYNVESHDRVNLMSAIRMYNVGAGGTSNAGRAEMRINRRRPGQVYNFIGRYIQFMEVPEEGGDFVFPWANVRVKPERGDVLYWQFRTPNGLVHPKLYHWLECPIMTGEMWYTEQMVEHHRMIKKVDFDFHPKSRQSETSQEQQDDSKESKEDSTSAEKAKKSKKSKSKKSSKKATTKTK